MKKIIGTALFLLVATGLLAQEGTLLERQAEKTKEKVKQRTENKVERGIDKGLDKTEEKIDETGKKATQKKPKNNENGGSEDSQNTPESTTNENDNANQQQAPQTPNDSPTKKPDGITATSKFDFVAGDKVLIFEDFSLTEIGDFPVNFNTNASGEVVTIAGETSRYLKLASQGVYLIDGMDNVPENFTLEFDLIASEDYSEMMSGLKMYLVNEMDQPLTFDQHFSSRTQVGFDIHPTVENCYTSIWATDESENQILSNEITLPQPSKLKYHISVWRQGTRYRVYVDDVKVFDVPRATYKTINYQVLFANYSFGGNLFLGNVRYAVGAPDTRNKLISEGKLVSRGILFDSNSDVIKAESVGALKEIAAVLQENPTVKVNIIGHTDADGDATANLDLSKRRAAAVKNTLVETFKIDASRLQTDGKGEAEPSDPNTTPAGKANNRRVEFVKL